MPAKTKKQRMMMAIAEHHPEELYEKNKGVLKMDKKKLSEFASGSDEWEGNSIMKKHMKKKIK